MAKQSSKKYPIEWHEECLKNATIYAEKLRNNILRLQQELDMIESRNKIEQRRIELARKRGDKELALSQ